MSFLMPKPKVSSEQKLAAAETELEMVSDSFNRISQSCMRKCIPRDYREAELNKGESVCVDRCVAKFFEVQMKVGEAFQEKAQQGGGMGMGI